MRNILLILIALITPSICAAGGESHGGDGHMVLFERAKDVAIDLLREATSPTKIDHLEASVKEWVLEHRDELQKDIKLSKHEWNDVSDKQKTCAQTKLEKNAPIYFKLEACKATTTNLRLAVEVLIHESVHHFGIADEVFPTRVALAITNAIDSHKAAQMEKVGFWREISSLNAPCKSGYNHVPNRTLVRIGQKAFVYGYIDVYPKHKPDEHCAGLYDSKTQIWKKLVPPNLDPQVWSPTESYLFNDQVFTLMRRSDEIETPEGTAYRLVLRWVVFNPESEEWTILKNDFLSEGGARHTAFDNGIILWGHRRFVSGGSFAANSIIEQGYVYFADRNEWVPIDQSKQPRARTSYESFWTGSEMYITDGWYYEPGHGKVYPRQSYAFNPKTGNWREVSTPPELLMNTHAVIVDDIVYVHNSPTPGKDSYSRYAISSDTWLPPLEIPYKETTSSNWRTIWSGTHLFVELDEGFALYDPKADKWALASDYGMPESHWSLSPSLSLWMGDRLMTFSSGGNLNPLPAYHYEFFPPDPY